MAGKEGRLSGRWERMEQEVTYSPTRQGGVIRTKTQPLWTTEAALENHIARNWARYAVGCFLVAFVAGWLPRLFWGFWTDETFTYWMAQGGVAAAIARCLHLPGQSVIYAAVVSLFAVRGPYMELLLRVPSLVGIGGSLYALYRIAEMVAGKGTGWLAVVPFACSPFVIQAATEARPYALALAASLAAFWMFIRWVESGRMRYLAAYVAFLTLVIYLHYYFAFILVVQFVYLLWRTARGQAVQWKWFLGAAALTGLLAAPLLGQIILTLRKASAIWHVASPTIGQFFLFSLPVHVIIGAAVGIAVVAALSPRSFRFRWELRSDWTFMLFAWLLLGPVLFFVAARVTTLPIFLPRYLLFAAPPFFMLLANGIRSVITARGRLLVLTAVLFGTVLHPAKLIETAGGPEDSWQAPLRALASESATTPVLMRSGFTESNFLDWRREPRNSTYLFAPLTAYPVKQRVVPLPFHLTRDAEAYVVESLAGPLGREPRVALVAQKNADMVRWMRSEFERRGYRVHLREFGGYAVVIFERP